MFMQWRSLGIWGPGQEVKLVATCPDFFPKLQAKKKKKKKKGPQFVFIMIIHV